MVHGAAGLPLVQKLPAGHVAHVPGVVAEVDDEPVVVEDVPATHVVITPPSQEEPMGHVVHDAAAVPPDANVRYVPAAHVVHVDALAADHLPDPHAEHVVADALEY